MNFSWDDERHIHPVWPSRKGHHPTIVIPSTQKNGRLQEVPMLPGMRSLLESISAQNRTGWIATPQPIEYEIKAGDEWFRPTKADLKNLVNRLSNCGIARMCGVSETTVRNWLASDRIKRGDEGSQLEGSIPETEVGAIRQRVEQHNTRAAQRKTVRLTKERVSRVIGLIGKEAGVLVRKADGRTVLRDKFASAHDLRRGCALRLINCGVSAETLKVVMRNADFATTEKHYGALRSAQAAAEEVDAKLTARNPSFVGGKEEAPQLSAEELLKLKALLNAL